MDEKLLETVAKLILYNDLYTVMIITIIILHLIIKIVYNFDSESILKIQITSSFFFLIFLSITHFSFKIIKFDIVLLFFIIHLISTILSYHIYEKEDNILDKPKKEEKYNYFYEYYYEKRIISTIIDIGISCILYLNIFY